MNRRGVLGMLGIGAAAGPAVVNQLGSQGSVPAIPSTGGYNFIDKAEAIDDCEIFAQGITHERKSVHTSHRLIFMQLPNRMNIWIYCTKSMFY